MQIQGSWIGIPESFDELFGKVGKPKEQLLDSLRWPGGSTVVSRGLRSLIASGLFHLSTALHESLLNFIMSCNTAFTIAESTTGRVPPVRWTASPAVGGQPLPDEGGSSGSSRLGAGRRLPHQLPPIEEGGLLPHRRQIVTPHTGS